MAPECFCLVRLKMPLLTCSEMPLCKVEDGGFTPEVLLCAESDRFLAVLPSAAGSLCQMISVPPLYMSDIYYLLWHDHGLLLQPGEFPKPGCFKPGCLQFLRGSALLHSFAPSCALLSSFRRRTNVQQLTCNIALS